MLYDIPHMKFSMNTGETAGVRNRYLKKFRKSHVKSTQNNYTEEKKWCSSQLLQRHG